MRSATAGENPGIGGGSRPGRNSGSAGAVTRADGLLTGEAVLLALPVAGPAVRIASILIDAVLYVALIVGSLFTYAAVGPEVDEALLQALSILLTVSIFVGLPTLLERLFGRTLGKLILGLRVVRDDGAPADLRRVVMRQLIGFVELWLLSGVPALTTALLTDPTRRLGDIAAGTFVVRDRVRLVLPPAPRMPRELDGWARGADLGRIPDELAAHARATLGQSRDFTAASSARLERDLAARISGYVSPPPPPGTSDRAFLHAALAERRRRESLRLEEQHRRRDRLFGAPTTLNQ